MEAAVRCVQIRFDSARTLFEAIQRILTPAKPTSDSKVAEFDGVEVLDALGLEADEDEEEPARLPLKGTVRKTKKAAAKPPPSGCALTLAKSKTKESTEKLAQVVIKPESGVSALLGSNTPKHEVKTAPAKVASLVPIAIMPAAAKSTPAKVAPKPAAYAVATKPPSTKINAGTAALDALAIIETRYGMATAYTMLMTLGSESDKQSACNEFARVVAAEGIVASIDELVRKIFVGAVAKRESIIQLHKAYTSGVPAPPAAVNPIEYGLCDCGATSEMAVDADRSELRCESCNAVRRLEGTMFEDADRYGQEGQKARSGTFNPNRHFQYWMLRIYARESEEELGDQKDPENKYGEKLIKQLRAVARRRGLIMQLLTVYDIRDMLREVDRTDLNKNMALIMKKLTGVGPPNVPDDFNRRVEKYFTKAIEIGERVRRKDRVNRNYYPYYIYKIIDALETDQEQRRVLYYIYMQSPETVINDDLDWEAICADPEMAESKIKYAPTDRNAAMIYQPI